MPQLYCGRCRQLTDPKFMRLTKDVYVCDDCREKARAK